MYTYVDCRYVTALSCFATMAWLVVTTVTIMDCKGTEDKYLLPKFYQAIIVPIC